MSKYISYLLYVYILSLTPSFEGRYALLVAIALGIKPIYAFIVASLGVITLALILPTLLPLIDKLMSSLSTSNYVVIRKVATTYLDYVKRVRIKASRYVRKWGFIGLLMFVAIPVPGTGVWSGAIAAYILNIEWRRTVQALIIGGIISNILTLLPSLIISLTF